MKKRLCCLIIILFMFLNIVPIVEGIDYLDFGISKHHIVVDNINQKIVKIDLIKAKHKKLEEGYLQDYTYVDEVVGEIPIEKVENGQLDCVIENDEIDRIVFKAEDGESHSFTTNARSYIEKPELYEEFYSKKDVDNLEWYTKIDYSKGKVINDQWRVVGKSRITSMVIKIAIGVLFALAVELVVSIPFGIGNGKLLFIINAITQTAFYIITNVTNLVANMDLLIYLTILISVMVIVDAICYVLLIKDKSRKRLILYSIIGNAASIVTFFTTGIVIDILNYF